MSVTAKRAVVVLQERVEWSHVLNEKIVCVHLTGGGRAHVPADVADQFATGRTVHVTVQPIPKEEE